MRLSSSLMSKGESAPILALGLMYFELVALANGVLLGVGVRADDILVVGNTMVDFEDLGVGVSKDVSNANWRWFLLLNGGRGLFLSSEFGLGGVSWKVFMILGVSGGLEGGGSCLSNQLYHHGNPPARMSDRGV